MNALRYALRLFERSLQEVSPDIFSCCIYGYTFEIHNISFIACQVVYLTRFTLILLLL